MTPKLTGAKSGPKDFVHLHVHSEFSVLDGLATVDQLVSRAKKVGQPALAITDHGVMCGHPAFYHACRKADIEPILGEEFYFVPDNEQRDKSEERYHVVILAKGEKGYKVLSELSTEAHRNFYYKPTIDRRAIEALGKDAEHLVVLSGCAASVISRAVRRGEDELAEQWTLWWRENCPNFYIELQHHDTEFDRQLNTGLIRLARKYSIPWVITNDPHYAVKEDCDYHDALLAIQTASDMDDPNRFRFDGNGYHLRSRQEIRRAFDEYGKGIWLPGIKTSVRIAKECHTRIGIWEKRTWHIPRYPDAPDAYKKLRELTKEGLVERGLHRKPEYVERAKHELKVIKQANISDFLLITLDSIQWAKSQGIPVGPGRGSVAGTLVGYLIGLHKIDPVRYNLMFERFLNPARPRMPDIDTDFGKERREELFDYVGKKYGKENVVHVCTYGRMKTKAAFRSLAKAHGVSYVDSNRIAKTLNDDDEGEDQLPEEIQKKYPALAKQLDRLAGVKRSISTHPAGVIIADPKHQIHRTVPEMWIPSTKRWVGQYDLEAVEEMGLMKQDFLGLRTLDTIKECVDLIEAHTGERIDPDTWVPDEEPDDSKVYAMLAKGKTAGVFQMEGPTNQRGIRDINCKEFEDVVSCTSLYRTGPISAGFPQKFLANRKRGKSHIQYAHPKLKPILKETWGVILYQEQVMEIGASLAGFDMALVDDLKEAIKHKKSALMESMRPRFVAGCKEHSRIDAKVSGKIWDEIEGYSGYAYNRSHAVAYTFISYQTARLKALYPLEYITALLRTVDDKEKREVYLREAVELGIKVLPPDINKSLLGATPDPELKAIRFGLLDIAGIGEKMAQRIISFRETYEESEHPGQPAFSSEDDVLAATRNAGAVKSLKKAYALAEFVESDLQQAEQALGWSFRDNMKKYRRKYANYVRLPNGSNAPVTLVGEIFKVDRGKAKNGKSFMTWKIRWSTTESFDVRLWNETESLWKLQVGSIVMVSGTWEPKWQNVSIGDPSRVRVLKRKIQA